MIREHELEQYQNYRKRVRLVNGSLLIIGLSVLLGALNSVWVDNSRIWDLKSERDILHSMSSDMQHIDTDWMEIPELATHPQNSAVLMWINTRAEESGCDVSGIQPQPASGAESSWLVSVRGSYHCIGKLIQAFEQSKHIVRVRQIILVPSRTGPALIADIDVSIWFVA